VRARAFSAASTRCASTARSVCDLRIYRFFNPILEARTCVLASIHWRASTSAWNADAGSAGRQSLTCQLADLLRFWLGMLPIRSARSRCTCLLSFGRASFPNLNPSCVPVSKRFSGCYSRAR
jgi:hypothetical protein